MRNPCIPSTFEPQWDCRDCGAVVTDPTRHQEFHETLIRALTNILDAGKGLLAVVEKNSLQQEEIWDR